MRLLLILLLCAGCRQAEEPPVPDVSACACSQHYEPVCGSDGRTYLNDCFTNCLKLQVAGVGNCPDASTSSSDTLRWPIEQVCIPIQRPEDPVFVRLISDGSALYQRPDGSYFRGNQNRCVCLPPWAGISTPEGELPLRQLRLGQQVYTLDAHGRRVTVPVLLLSTNPVKNHRMLLLKLADGRQLMVSPLHPDAGGRPLATYRPGDTLDQAEVCSLQWVDYEGSLTMDLLPAGTTGLYWADGVLLGSTLRGKSGKRIALTE